MKKILHYKPTADDYIIVGHNAYLHHPVEQGDILRRQAVITGKVVSIQEAHFETENTIYARAHFS